GLVLEADLPGVAESDVNIQLEDNVLVLHARVANPAPEGARPLHEEFRLGDFVRSFILSDEVERSKITAELRSGVLRLTLPKAERV
ncbi:Hsp20/alpha crystallin family protein, partial [Staphylococcus aureus]